MKSKAIMALSVLGVLGTAGAAMAVNSDTLTSAPAGLVGQATAVLAPVATSTATPPSLNFATITGYRTASMIWPVPISS